MYQPGIIFEADHLANGSTQWKVPQPEDLPFLNGVTRLGMDTENDSLNPFKANIAGISLAWRNPENLNLEKIYAPIGHIEGNMDPEVVKSWLNYVLEGKEVIFANGKYDIPILKRAGIDLEALNVKPRDVAFPAALLDDSPYIDLSLDGIARRYVGRGKMEFDGDKNRIAQYPSWRVAAYAMEDSVLNLESDEAMMPMIDQEGLDRVLELEFSIMYAVCEIEKNGCRLDVDKLHRWRKEVRDEFEAIVMEIRRQTGLLIEPGTAEGMARLFHHLNITPPVAQEEQPKKGKKGKKAAESKEPTKPKKKGARVYKVEELLAINHPIFNLVIEARRRESLLSKFLDKYADAVEGDLLRAQFHQLKTAKSEEDEKGNKGVAWGRFSSSGGDRGSGFGFNAQQVIRADKQVAELGDSHILRELFIPDEGYEWGTSDAKQIEYRIFASLASARSVIDAYDNDPDTDYHGFVHEKVRKIRPAIDRTTIKNTNFGFIFGASPRTTARTAGISIKEAEEITEYCRSLMPERDPFLNKCSYEAEHRGHVSTILGRRARFGEDDPFYKAVNRVVQGCIIGESRIYVRGEGYINLKAAAYRYVDIWDGEKYVNALVAPSGKRQKVKVMFYGGQVIECSPDHRFRIMYGSGRFSWKTPSQLKYVGTNRTMVLLGNPPEDARAATNFPEVEVTKHWKAPKGVANTKFLTFKSVRKDFEVGVALGRLASDGSVSKGKGVVWLVAEHEIEIEEYLTSILTQIGKIRRDVRTKDKVTKAGDPYKCMIYLTIDSSILARQADLMGVKRKVPDAAWKNKDILSGFLRGVFDGDGGVSCGTITLGMKYSELKLRFARDIQKALLLFGIRCRIHSNPELKCIHLSICRKDNLRFANKIGFINSRKQALADASESKRPRIGKLLKRTMTWVKAVEVTDEWEEMYDVVNSPTEQFMVDGLVTHNSAADIFKLALRDLYREHKTLGIHKLRQIVHDEFNFDKDPGEVHTKRIRDFLDQQRIDLKIPIRWDVKTGRNWKECK